MSEIREKIKNILVEYLGFEKKEALKLYDINKEFFLKSITHISVDERSNYEDLEFIGDKLITPIIATQLFDRYAENEKTKNVKKTVTNILKYAISEAVFPKFSRKLGLDEIVRFDKDKLSKTQTSVEKILEDVFEAFVGALFYALKSIYDMRAHLLIAIFLTNVFAGTDFETESRNAKQTFHELMKAHGIDNDRYKIIFTSNKEKDSYIMAGTLFVISNKTRHEIMKKHPILTKSGIKRIKKKSELDLYQKFIDELERNPILFEQMKQKIMM